MFDFLVLPREIREKIYFYALVRPYDLISYPTEWQLKERAKLIQDNLIERGAPIMALLATCKHIQSEGNTVFYNRNRFRLPNTDIDNAMDASRSVFVQYKSDIRHISVSFDSRDLYTPMREYISRKFRPPQEMLRDAHLQRAYRAHCQVREIIEVEKIWMHVASRSLQDGTALPALRTIVLSKFIWCIC